VALVALEKIGSALPWRIACYKRQPEGLGVHGDLVGVVQVQHTEMSPDGSGDVFASTDVAPRTIKNGPDAGAPDVTFRALENHARFAVPEIKVHTLTAAFGHDMQDVRVYLLGGTSI